MLLKVFNYSSFKYPALAQAAYKIGTAWPLDNTILSFPKYFGFYGSYFIPNELKKLTEIKSAHDEADVGWPLFADKVISTA